MNKWVGGFIGALCDNDWSPPIPFTLEMMKSEDFDPKTQTWKGLPIFPRRDMAVRDFFNKLSRVDRDLCRVCLENFDVLEQEWIASLGL